MKVRRMTQNIYFKKKGTLKVLNIHYLLRTKDEVRMLT